MLTNNDLVVLLSFVSTGLLVTTVGFAIAWVRARERALRDRIASPQPPADPHRIVTPH